jgi:hypothetical protein
VSTEAKVNDLSFQSKILLTVKFVGNRVGIEIPKIEVRFQKLSVEGDAYVGTRALPTLLNSTLNAVEVIISLLIYNSAGNFQYFLHQVIIYNVNREFLEPLDSLHQRKELSRYSKM